MADPEDGIENAGLRPPIKLSAREARQAARLISRLLGKDHDAVVKELFKRPANAPVQIPADRKMLHVKAREVFFGRRLRKKHFSRAIFDEPAWDILLAMYIADFTGVLLTIGRVAEWIETAHTTTLRWIDYLNNQRLITREPNPDDKRYSHLRLEEKARKALDSYFAELVG